MKQVLFFFLLYAGTITSLIQTAESEKVCKDALESCCLVCGTKEKIVSLCVKEKNHTLSCRKHCPKFFAINHCSECHRELKPIDLLPSDFKDEINAVSRDTELFNLEKKIEMERLNHIKAHHTLLVDSIAHTFGCKVTRSNCTAVEQTKQAIAIRGTQHQSWELIVSIISYYRARQAMLRNPEDDEIPPIIAETLKKIPKYNDQETAHVIGTSSGKFENLLRQTEEALKHFEGSDGDVLPNLLELKKKDMTVDETRL